MPAPTETTNNRLASSSAALRDETEAKMVEANSQRYIRQKAAEQITEEQQRSHHVALFSHVYIAARLALYFRRHALRVRHLVPRERGLIQGRRVQILIESARNIEQSDAWKHGSGGRRFSARCLRQKRWRQDSKRHTFSSRVTLDSSFQLWKK